jgi:ribosomal protein L24E
VSFQEVVHPVRTEEAEVVEALANPRRIEWTPIRMRLSHREVERQWCGA